MSVLPKMEVTTDEIAPQKYSEAEPIRLSKDDSVAFVNSIRFPAKANDHLKQAMRKHLKKS